MAMITISVLALASLRMRGKSLPPSGMKRNDELPARKILVTKFGPSLGARNSSALASYIAPAYLYRQISVADILSYCSITPRWH